MRILLVNKYFYRKGGAETYFFALAEGLRALGHEVAFFSMQHPNNESSCFRKGLCGGYFRFQEGSGSFHADLLF